MRLGIAGLGTVAQGLLTLLSENASRISRQVGEPISVARVASRSPKTNVCLLEATFSTDLDSLLHDDVDIVVELIGGVDDAHRLIEKAIDCGKSVVTANKAVLAKFGNSYIEQALKQKVSLGFEASVAGGIPVVATIKDGLAGNRVDSLTGILNGTCNYILSAMDRDGSTFESVLKEAQILGYAESDPSFDVDGIDASQKLAILASIAFDQPIDVEDIYIEGIRDIKVEDLRYARQLGYRVKHIAVARTQESSVQMRVHPALIEDGNLLSAVDGVDNAISINANGVGTLLLKGPGAGARPTASAVLSDIIEIARDKSSLPEVGALRRRISAIGELETAYYLNIRAADEPGVMASVASTLSQYDISMEAVIQRSQEIQKFSDRSYVPVVVLTNKTRESVVDEAIRDIEGMGSIEGPIRRIRVVDTNEKLH